MFETADFSNLPSFGVGHAQNAKALTGCTVIVAPDGAACSVDVRGGGPATRETDLLSPEKMIQKIHAVVLSGGSAFGLESACGAMEVLAERKIGFSLGTAFVPIVPAACIFDLLIGQPIWPDKAMGAEATLQALESQSKNAANLAQGSVGAGTGATVGKLGTPEQAMKSGFGWSGLRLGDIVVVVCVAVNALGNVKDRQGNWIAGVHDENGNVIDPYLALASRMASQSAQSPQSDASTNTTIGAVLTNANLTKAECKKVSQVTHDAYARAIVPVHTQNDGDAIFTLASGETEADVDLIGIMATEAMQQAIINAVTADL